MQPGFTLGNHAGPVRRAAAALLITADRGSVRPARLAGAFAAVETKILAGFLLAMSLLLFSGAYTYRTGVELADAMKWVAHTQVVRATLADVYGSLAGAELAQRDYLLVPQPSRLDEHLHLVESARSRLADLARLTSDNPAQQRNWTDLDSAVTRHVERMAAALAAYASYGLPAARSVLGVGRQSGDTADIRTLIDRMDAVEMRLSVQRQSASVGARQMTLISLLITLALAAAVFMALFRGVHREMRARRGAELALRQNAVQLGATNKELESFSYSVSHDLRAPLRAIDGFALMLEEDYGGRLDREGRRYLAVIRDNSRRMGKLIDDLLTFSRLGRQPVVSHEVNVDSLVREVIEEVLVAEPPRERGNGPGSPQFEIGPLPLAHGDRGLLRQVWTNLISNAVKYSSKAAQPSIQVSGRRIGGENQYSVRDNGVGFDMQYAEKLFQVFQRLHRADEFGGTGVGLAIVHRVVTRHGGRVWAEGKVDQGAVFSFALPIGERSG